jgi:hypothetical protein
MRCESVREQLTAYLDGDLNDTRGSAVRGHLRGCEACRQVATDEAALRDGLRALPPLDPPPSLWAGVQQRLAAAEVADAEQSAWRRALARWMPRAPQIGLASAAVAAAVILLAVRMQRDDAPVQETASTENDPVAVRPDRVEPAPAPRPAPISDEDDVTASLASEPARITESYAQTTRELLDVAAEARAQWPDDRKREFDTQLSALQKKVALASDERPRRAAYRRLIRFLQRAVIHDDVALADIGGAQ